MIKLRVHFDGHNLIPDEPLDLPIGCSLDVYIAPASDKPALEKLAELAATFPPNPHAPTGAASQHDHHLYGTPKKRHEGNEIAE